MAIWQKVFQRINWRNEPSTATPINETNLNYGDAALNTIDDRVIELNNRTLELEGYETEAAQSAADAAASATAAAGSATAAAGSATDSHDYADDAHGWCDNKGDSGASQYGATNNSYYWAQQAAQAAASSHGHTILDKNGNSMTQRSDLQFTGDVTVSDDSTNGKTVVNVSGGGHTIQKSDNTDMPQRTVMKFTGSGVAVTDDSTNGKTVITIDGEDYTVLTYTEFEQLTPTQQNTGNYIVTGMNPLTNAYNMAYKNGQNVGQALDTAISDLSELEEGLSSYVVVSATSVNGAKTIQQILNELLPTLKNYVDNHTWRENSQLTMKINGSAVGASAIYPYLIYHLSADFFSNYEFSAKYEDVNEFDFVTVLVHPTDSYICQKYFTNGGGYGGNTVNKTNAFTGTITIYGLK